MKANTGKTAIAALLAAVLAVPALQAADETLADYKIGETLRGDKVSKEDLEGRVVVIEYWGVQ